MTLSFVVIQMQFMHKDSFHILQKFLYEIVLYFEKQFLLCLICSCLQYQPLYIYIKRALYGIVVAVNHEGLKPSNFDLCSSIIMVYHNELKIFMNINYKCHFSIDRNEKVVHPDWILDRYVAMF